MLITNVIGIAQVYDIREKAGARHLDSLVDSIKSCGVTFSVKFKCLIILW